MLQRCVEYLFNKVGEKLVDSAHNIVTGTTNSEFDFTTLETNFNSLCATASDVEDQIKANPSGQKKRKREVEHWLKQVQVIETDFHELQSRGFITRVLHRGRVAQMIRRVSELVEQSRHFGEVLLDAYDMRGEALLTTEMFGSAFEENLDTIWELLVNDKVASVGIYGMGGVGKTTLMKHIHNRLLGETRDCVCWITVSQVFSIKKLQDEIARAINLELTNENDMDRRAARLNAELSQRESMVLILDDVWENIDLQKVGYPLGREGCRLIMTTRSLKVCHQIGCKKITEVKTLYHDEAWDLFKVTLGHESIAPEVEGIAKCMVKMCDGLPLGIITLAGSLRGKTAIHAWRNAWTELKKSFMGQDDMEDKVYKVLKYSFDRLLPNHQRQGKRNGNTNLQSCFLYCALYPEDCKIPRNELVRKLISDELEDTRKSMKAQYDEGHSMLDKLVNMSLLESSHNDVDGDSVKMHDLMRAMALKITEGKTVVTAGHNLKEMPKEEEWSEDLENMSLMQNSIRMIPFQMSPNCPKLSILLLCENPLVYLPEPFFSRTHGLSSLDLSRTGITDLPNSVSDLESLKALLLGECRELAYVPNLGKLKALRELDLSNSGIRNMPLGTEKLLNLTCLLLNGANYLRMLPTGMLLNLTNLQLLLLPYQIQTPVEGIERLKQLEKFEGTVEDAWDISHFLRSRQSRPHGTFYSIEVRLAYDRFSRRRNQVILHLCDLEKGDEKHATMSGRDILVFRCCEGLSNCLADDFSQLDDRRSLKSLEIYNSRGIEYIMASKERESQFSSLEKILLQDLPDFMGLIHRQEIESAVVSASSIFARAAFSSLKYLTICKCNKMKKLGLPALEFPNLEILCVQYCDEIEEIIETADDTGRGEAGAPVVSLPKLRHLYLIRLPRLTSICKATMICDSINLIHLEECQALKKLPLNFPAGDTHTLHGVSYQCSPPPSLEEIWIIEEEREWWESLEWEHPIHSHLIQPFLRFWD